MSVSGVIEGSGSRVGRGLGSGTGDGADLASSFSSNGGSSVSTDWEGAAAELDEGSGEDSRGSADSVSGLGSISGCWGGGLRKENQVGGSSLSIRDVGCCGVGVGGSTLTGPAE